MIKLERDRYGNDGSVVRARKTRYCEGYRCRGRKIAPGEFYYRAVAFPGSEVVEKGNPPWVMTLCRECLNEPMLERFDAAVASLLPSVTRDNGTIYTPRSLRAIMLGDEDEVNEVVVLGTNDFERATPVARDLLSQHWAEWIKDDDSYPTPIEPMQTWIARTLLSWSEIDGPRHQYGVDREKGAAAVRFNISWGTAPENRLYPTDISPTPLTREEG